MGTLLLVLVAILMPTALGFAWVGSRRAYAAWDQRRPALPAPPVERLHADLRRLHDLLASTENSSELLAKRQRCEATRAAYVDALSAACRHFEVRLPQGRPVPQAEIYRVEADLRLHGLDVRPVS